MIPARDEAAVRAAVLRFTAKRDGWIWEPAEGSLRRRLRIGRYRVLMVLTLDGQHVSVVRLYRAPLNTSARSCGAATPLR